MSNELCEKAMKEVPDSLPIVVTGIGSGWPQVQGVCPACGTALLFLGSGGWVTCAVIECPDPWSACNARRIEADPPNGDAAHG